MKKLIFGFLLLVSTVMNAQGSITGKVIDKSTKEGLPGVNLIIMDTNLGAATDINGDFIIRNVPIGKYSVRASYVGYLSATKTDVVVNSVRPANLLFELSSTFIELNGVTVQSEYFDMNPNEFNSVKSFSYEEIRRAPGGFEDVVRALSVLPGVGQVSAGRNDLVVRGGAPSENLFLVDGFTVPNINHFGTQGATGGPLSYINLDFVRETTFSTGGFPANYGDKLSSVLKIDLRDGRNDRIGGKATISASQFGFNVEGPIDSKSNFIFSARRSYLDFIFNAAGFNFVPEYYDVMSKASYNIDSKNKINWLFIGAFDKVKFNNKDSEDLYENSRILGSNQNQYLVGVSYRHIFDNGFYNFSISRNFVDYDTRQRDTLLNPIFTNISREGENEIKGDAVIKLNETSEINFGISGKLIKFSADILLPTFMTSFGETLQVNSLQSAEYFYKYGFYSQYSTTFFSRLMFTAGLRGDYFDRINSGFTLSPRGSLSYVLNEVSSVSFSTGLYHQSPSYLWLASFKQNENLKPVKVIQYVAGYERRLTSDLRLKLEAFYKDYSDYPASLLRPYLVLANTGVGFGGSDENFGSLGLEPLISAGKGFARGLEFSLQKKSSDTPGYGILSVTYNESFFKGLDGIERAGSFDQKWIINLSGGYSFNEK
ncbi:MAG: TonB-dependent receptor, partial [Ignavibacteriaceae bacterium]|nr:TonB-dependent receptor [Ignavibacteriaceae bacterium]